MGFFDYANKPRDMAQTSTTTSDGLPPVEEARFTKGASNTGASRVAASQLIEANSRLARIEVLLARQVGLLERIAEQGDRG